MKTRYSLPCRLPPLLILRLGLVMVALTFTSCTPRASEPQPTATPVPTATPIPGAWRVTQVGDDLRIAFGVSPAFPQYASLDLASGFLRLVYGPDSQFGTSALLVPAVWIQDQTLCPPAAPAFYCQGTRVAFETHEEGPFLVLHVEGKTAGLSVTTDVTFSRPSLNSLSAHITSSVAGSPPLYPNPGQTFKLVMLSSMHVSSTQWDSKRAFTEEAKSSFDLPDAPAANEFIGDSGNPVSARIFGLEGGTSSWKMNAPTIEVTFDAASCQVLGYVTKSSHPTDDNIGYWCATDHVISSWAYTILARPASP